MLFTTRKNSRKALHEKIERLETRLKLATGFLSKIAEGDQALASFELNADEKDEEGKLFLEKLTRTKEKLAEYTQRDRERVWVAEGMSKFMDVIQGDRTAKDFYDKVLTMILRYSGAIQGVFFMLN
jgi:hypothetical protein